MLVCSQIELQVSTLVAKLIVDLPLRRLALQVTSVSSHIKMMRHLIGNKFSISTGFHRMDNWQVWTCKTGLSLRNFLLQQIIANFTNSVPMHHTDLGLQGGKGVCQEALCGRLPGWKQSEAEKESSTPKNMACFTETNSKSCRRVPGIGDPETLERTPSALRHGRAHDRGGGLGARSWLEEGEKGGKLWGRRGGVFFGPVSPFQTAAWGSTASALHTQQLPAFGWTTQMCQNLSSEAATRQQCHLANNRSIEHVQKNYRWCKKRNFRIIFIKNPYYHNLIMDGVSPRQWYHPQLRGDFLMSYSHYVLKNDTAFFLFWLKTA